MFAPHPSWPAIVQSAYLLGQGATQVAVAESVGCTTRTIRNWKKDEELWQAALEAEGNPEPETQPETNGKPRSLPARLEPDETCNARTRAGTPCAQTAGSRTDHPGLGRCWLHGGRSVVKHGRYSTVKHEELAELIREMEADPEPLDVLPELATTRALLRDWLDRYKDLLKALFAWNAAENADAKDESRKPRPQRIPDLREALPLLSEVSKIVKRIEDVRSANAISRPDLHRLMGEMGRVVAHHSDEDTAQVIRDDWLRIRL